MHESACPEMVSRCQALRRAGFFDRVRTGELMNRLSEACPPHCRNNTSPLAPHVLSGHQCAFVGCTVRIVCNVPGRKLAVHTKHFASVAQDTRLMKSAGTISISIALRSIVVSIFGVVLMFMTSPLLSALTLACLPVRQPSRLRLN